MNLRHSPSLALLLLPAACADARVTEEPTQEVFVYRACASSPPGELAALPRRVPADYPPLDAAIDALVGGVSDDERAQGCTSHFSSRTASALQTVRHSAVGDTVAIDFHDFSDALPADALARSFLPPGVMAELTWTIFRQFPDVAAVRFSFDGDERAFWSWVASAPAEPQTFTRAMWERI